MQISRIDPRRAPSPFRLAFLSLAAACLPCLLQAAGAPASPCSPAWSGTTLIDCDSLAGWAVEKASGSSGTLRLVPGIVGGQAVQLEWDLGTGDWVQAKFSFSRPADLSRADIFGLTLLGGGPSELPNTVGILFADANDVFHGYDIAGKSRGANQIDRPLMNLAIPKKLLRFYFAFGQETQIDWTRINRFFLVVKRPGPGTGGGSGRLSLDQVQRDTAAAWTRQAGFEPVTPKEEAAHRAVDFILAQQKPTGLIVSWKEEPSLKAWLYDQALALLVLSREGLWQAGAAGNDPARAADRLASFLAGRQKADGHWARCWNPLNTAEIMDDGWVGDQAWCVMALADHFRRSGRGAAMASASKGAGWLASRIDAAGKLVASTEGNVDAWWAMVSTCRFDEAEKIRKYLLGEGNVWDPELRFWWRGYGDPMIAMDANTWVSAFARHPLVGETEKGLAALSFVRRALVTASDDGAWCGFDSMGPVSVWNEGTAQFVAAGGMDADRFLDGLLARQRPDGSMPGSTDDWTSDGFGWLSSWSGLAPTAWLYFALKGMPFPMEVSNRRGDANGDGRLDMSDPLAILVYLFLEGRIENGCGEAIADANGDGRVDIGDPIFLLTHFFLGGAGPPSGPPACGCGGG